jgi:hypothetical protein
VIARVSDRRTKAELRDGQQQQQQTDQLQQERPGLLQLAAVFQYGRLFDSGKEAQRGDRVALAQRSSR